MGGDRKYEVISDGTSMYSGLVVSSFCRSWFSKNWSCLLRVAHEAFSLSGFLPLPIFSN